MHQWRAEPRPIYASGPRIAPAPHLASGGLYENGQTFPRPRRLDPVALRRAVPFPEAHYLGHAVGVLQRPPGILPGGDVCDTAWRETHQQHLGHTGAAADGDRSAVRRELTGAIASGRASRNAAATEARSEPTISFVPSTTICGVYTRPLSRLAYSFWRSVEASVDSGSFQPSRSQ